MDIFQEQEASWVQLAQRGDEGAFSKLMTKYKEKAVQLAYLKMGNFEDAKDVAQEAFVKVYKALPRFEGKSKFSTWLYRIVMTTAYDAWRAKKWKKFVVFKKQSEMTFFLEQQPSGGSQSQSLAQQEREEWVQNEIRQLSEKQRIIFILRYVENHSLSEIAEITSASMGTVKSSLHFAVQKLKTKYALKEGG